ncbi:methyl-accepting chemotaxis protein [Neorhizobium petrolearium]|uniref:Methyl-accepting chemotaxis protein n=1 Tax=Neorhizobium petrolearium TaxID=515361 RepID=A0ABY8M3D1_9HYPH|nr:methyl-accepting chemotaxis protein [Neorhizobium petrolearium]MCC2608725.1 methyl-accepting chemotaxis protein [Neorhizobium petrolearium]WGI68984.1 methyl-accepting chemotaxis protein [Neorhizobium petrolearium]
MKNLKISQQLLLLIVAIMVAFAAVTYYQVRTSIASIYAERYDMLRTQVESATSILQSYYEQEKAGKLTHEEAQRLAYATAAGIKFEPAGYIFGMNYDTVTQFHYNPKLVGVNQKGQPDKMGNLFREEIVAHGRAGGGITTYYWEKPGKPANEVYKKAVYSKAFEPWQIVVATGVYIDDLDAKINKAIAEVAVAGLVAVIIAMILAFFVIRNITRPLGAVHAALEAVADEDVAIKVPHTDMANEVGMMAKATQELQEKIRERHAMAAREEQQKQELDRERQQNLDMQQQEAVMQARVVSIIGEALESLANGDLTIRCGDLGPRYETLRHNFNEAILHLEAAMAKVNAKGIDIGGSKEEIRRASNELSQRTERQAANLEETSAALDELAVAVRQTAEGAHEAAQRVTSVSSEANRSDQIVAEAIDAMGGIEHSSEEISKIIGVIDDIAFQTNLLALNAGVEAARAGDSGKGFAVVAQEVRELAQRSAAAAKEIKDQISRSSGQVQNGVRLVGEAGEALKRISSQVKAASDIVGKIAHSASEQDTTLRSISSSLNQLDAATQHNAAMAEETTASAEALATDTDELLNLIRGFRVGNDGISSLHHTAQKMRKAG